jgi:hypothetical protein
MVFAIMRLLFDAHWWVDGPPSNRNVLRSLVTEWLQAFPADDLTLRVPKKDVSYLEGEKTVS